jgi:hypothetical protein
LWLPVAVLYARNVARNVAILGAGPAGALSQFTVTYRGAGCFDASIPKERFQEFMERLFICGGHVLLVEPQRRSLEALFLEIVGRTS